METVKRYVTAVLRAWGHLLKEGFVLLWLNVLFGLQDDFVVQVKSLV